MIYSYLKFQIAEKDTEIVQFKEKLKSAEDLVNNVKKELEYKTKSFLTDMESYKKEKQELEAKIIDIPYSCKKTSNITEEVFFIFI